MSYDVTVDSRQNDIENDRRELRFSGLMQPVCAAVGHGDAVMLIFQAFAKKFRHAAFVFDDQHTGTAIIVNGHAGILVF
jgi:hypothetical protein